MGTIQPEYLIVQVSDFEEGIKAVDAFITALPLRHRNLFTKSKPMSNGYITYFMNWDGSKEGWKTSDEADKVREDFIEVVNENLEYAGILHIKPRGELFEEDSIDRR